MYRILLYRTKTGIFAGNYSLRPNRFYCMVKWYFVSLKLANLPQITIRRLHTCIMKTMMGCPSFVSRTRTYAVNPLDICSLFGCALLLCVYIISSVRIWECMWFIHPYSSGLGTGAEATVWWSSHCQWSNLEKYVRLIRPLPINPNNVRTGSFFSSDIPYTIITVPLI